ncbi:unnamed protein product [Lactuca saligna]|uniref:Glutamate receptor n=1 Tax=Lactuca saligna TaxID=75948 RepID=A0AA35ZXX9_LACSI|nr:unnamed protein product [Lactuca saligna]
MFFCPTGLHFLSSLVKRYLCQLDAPRAAGNLNFRLPMANSRLFSFLILMLLSFQTLLTANEDPSYKDIQVGVILDMESWVGKIVYGCITQAISDFYTENPHYRTRIVFTKRDTQGETLRALSAALDLLENSKMQAIIEDETTQFKGIAAMVESFETKNVIVLCEDTTDGREMVAYMFSAFQEKGIQVKHTSLISTYASKEQVGEELHKLQTIPAMVFVVHTPPSLAAHLFSMAKELGMMDEGYMWIITSKTTNLLDSMDAEAIKSMQGAVGFRSYLPASRKLHNFSSKWRKEHYALNPFKEFKEVDSNGIWAYDAVHALATAIESVKTKEFVSKELDIVGTSLLDEMLRVNFQGLGGEFKLMNARSISKAMEVVNVIGKGGRRVGFWMMMSTNGEFVKEIGKSNSSSNHGLESIILPGGSETSPKCRMLQANGKKLRILVPDFATFPNLLQLTVDPITNLSGVSGFCGDVFSAAFNALDYGVGVEIIQLPYKDGMSYDDVIEKISLKEYDVAVGDITITANRSLYVDFTLPFTDLGIGTLVHNSKKSTWIFLDPLSADLWITSACFFLFLGFVVWFIEHPTNEEFQGSARQQFGTTLWFSFSTLVYAHREKLQSNLSRFVVTVWVFVVLVLTSSYTATLSSLLTVQQIGMNQISIGFLDVSPLGGLVFNRLNFGGPKIEKLYSPDGYAKALTSGSVDAIINEILYLKTVIAMYPSSDLSLIATASTTNGFGFVFQKGSPLAGEMSTEIAKMRQDGTLKTLEDKWLKHESAHVVIPKDFSSPSPKILNLYGFRGLFLISGGTMACSLLVSIVHLFCEKLHVKIKMHILRYILRSKIAGLIC